MQKTLIFFALVALLCVAQTSAADVTGFIDAGSSGSKVFRVEGSTTTDAKSSPGISALENINNALAIKNDKNADVKTIAKDTSDFRKQYIKSAMSQVFKAGDKAKDGVPMQATAGMRIVSRSNNALIFDNTNGVCDTKLDNADVAVPKAGEKCGTIAGTVEAFYEWLAIHKNIKNKDKTKPAEMDFKFGIISSGGASAQMAWPLTSAETDKLKKFRADLDKDEKLPKYQMDNEFPPFFNAINDKSRRYLAKRNWLNDFVSYVPYRELPKSFRDEFKKQGFYSLAVVSFLSIGPDKRQGKNLADNMFLAGGVNEVTDHLKANDFCKIDNNAYDYAKCRHALTELFKKDYLFSQIAKWFHAVHQKDSIPFYANTPASGYVQVSVNDPRPAGDKFVTGVANPTWHSTIIQEIRDKHDNTPDALNPGACKAEVGDNDARKCYDALSKWLAMRCTNDKLKAIKFNENPKKKDDFFSSCGASFFADAYYFTFFTTHSIEWPTTAENTKNEFAGDDAANALAVKKDFAKDAKPSADGLTEEIRFKPVDWTAGALYYYEDSGAPFTHLLRPKGGKTDPKPEVHREATDEEVQKEKGVKKVFFVEESGKFKLRDILVNNRA